MQGDTANLLPIINHQHTAAQLRCLDGGAASGGAAANYDQIKFGQVRCGELKRIVIKFGHISGVASRNQSSGKG